MRILYLASTFHPIIGGAETYAMNLACGLGERGHIVKIVTDSVPGQSEHQTLSENVTVRRLNKYRHEFDAPDKILWEQMQFGLCDELSMVVDELHPDIIISNSLDLCVPAKLASIHINKPWVATFHEQTPEKESLGIARLKLSYEILKPDAVIAGSKFYFARAQRFGNTQKSHLIYHGIDTEQFHYMETSADVRKHYNIPDSQLLIVSAGRLKPRKGFPDVIHALQILRSKRYEASLIIAGSLNSASVSHSEYLKKLVQDSELTQYVVFDDKITHERMPWLLSGSDIAVQASLEEGLGLSVIEAMSCSRPVVTTRIPGIIEIMTDDGIGILIEPQSPKELAMALETLLENEEYRKNLGIHARKHIIQNFSLKSMITKTESLLNLLILQGTEQ